MIIDHGTVVAEGTPRALKQQVAGDAIVLVTRDADAAGRAAAALAGQPGVRDLTAEGTSVRLVVAIGYGFGFNVHAGGLLVLSVLLALLMATVAAFSIAIALTTGDISGFAAIINGLNLPVLLLGGVLLPISLGPEWMRVLAHVNPLYYGVSAARVLAAGTLTGSAVWQAFAVLTPLCVVVLSWATSVVRRAVAVA